MKGWYHLDFFAFYGYYVAIFSALRGAIDFTITQEDYMTTINYVDEQNFQTEVIDSSLPVLVDFTAVWCGPCKTLEPVITQLAQEWDGKAKIVKLDVDESANLAVQYQVMGVPTLMLFSKGKPVERTTGYQPLNRLLDKFEPHLK